MRKLILLLLIIVVSSSVASAQLLKVAVKGGVNINSSDFVLKGGNLGSQTFEGIKNNAGYHLGFMTRVNLGGLYVQGDLLYVRNSYEYNLGGDQKMTVKENRLDVPVVAGINFLFLRAYAGPRFDFNLGQNIKKSVENSDAIKSIFDNRWLGYQIGIGADLFKRISLDISYNGYFKAPAQQFIVGTDSYQVKQKSRQYWITLGYYLGGGNKKHKN